MFDGYLT